MTIRIAVDELKQIFEFLLQLINNDITSHYYLSLSLSSASLSVLCGFLIINLLIITNHPNSLTTSIKPTILRLKSSKSSAGIQYS